MREALYNNFNLQFPTSKPLWSYKEGLTSIICPDGTLNPLPSKGLVYQPLNEQQKREKFFNEMVINKTIVDLNGKVLIPNVPHLIDLKVNKIIYNRKRYTFIAHEFPNPIKWYHIGLLHEMECEQNFNCYLGNGQPWRKKTTIVPKGRGPFRSFEDGALDAIKFDKLDLVKDWSIGNTLYILEGFNGYGYEKYHNQNSPYLWSGSNQYTSGKYVVDSVYSKTTVSSQIGIALLLKVLLSRI